MGLMKMYSVNYAIFIRLNFIIIAYDVCMLTPYGVTL